ncbi:hypothetical protein [Saccharothrix sp. HUAS TT1]
MKRVFVSLTLLGMAANPIGAHYWSINADETDYWSINGVARGPVNRGA